MKPERAIARFLAICDELHRFTGADDLGAWESEHPDEAEGIGLVLDLLEARTDAEAERISALLAASERLKLLPERLGDLYERLAVRLLASGT